MRPLGELLYQEAMRRPYQDPTRRAWPYSPISLGNRRDVVQHGLFVGDFSHIRVDVELGLRLEGVSWAWEYLPDVMATEAEAEAFSAYIRSLLANRPPLEQVKEALARYEMAMVGEREHD